MTNAVSKLNRVAVGDAIRRTARRYPTREALVDGSRRVTYKELNESTNQIANYLLQQGYQKGDKIVTLAFNSAEHIQAMYGIKKAALVWVPINIGLISSDIQYILEKVQVKLVIVDEMLYQAHASLLNSYNCLIIKQGAADCPFTNAYLSQSMEEPDADIQDRDVAHIMFTSGTTGHPKGVLTSHLAIHMSGLSYLIEVGANRDFSLLGVMPFFHCAQHVFIHGIMIIGGKITIMKKFDPVQSFQLIEQEKVNFTFLLPIMYRAFIHHPERTNYDISSLKQCLYAMAPMDQTTLETGINELGADFFLASGQTEIYPATVIFNPEYQLSKKGSYWGEPTLINDLAIMDEEGNLLEHGKIGEIVHRGPNVMIGYLDNAEATAESRMYDWHHTSDLGYFDEDGLLVFADRKKDMIKTGGENVASIQVEQKLLNCPFVENVIVVGLPHPRWTEAVTAFVKVKEQVTEQQLLDYCKQHLSSFEVPKKVVIVEEFPMTSTGKIQKNKLREWNVDLYAEEMV